MAVTDPFSRLSDHQLKMIELFHPYAYKKTKTALEAGMRFVHYTSADAVLGIFKSQEVWMRKSSCMNDYMEVEHGFNCLNESYKKNRERFSAIFEKTFPDFCGKLEERFNGWLPHFRTDSYIACLSEHDDHEDVIGRLSMWRAYGGVSRVALVLNNSPLLMPSDALKAYTSPVAYLDRASFDLEFSQLLNGIEENIDSIGSLGEDAVLSLVFESFRSAILCMKHPGFREEREWRVIYTPSYGKSERLIADIQSINGTPQPIYKIPLVDVPSEGLIGVDLSKFIDRVIIGPTQYPFAICEALATLLMGLGMKDASSRVIVSDIPLRL